MRNLLLTIASISLVAIPASAPAAASAEAAGASDKLVCKLKPRTGTRFPSKTCRTTAEWDQIAEQNKRDAADMTNRPVLETRRPCEGAKYCD
jgi:hypothetical protein